ncbi:MAG TPA: GatB/YqeY domain-containing protein [Clostridia bacterium]|nr:GatB/YqeY domain-containing protein [Clostridia bacterium]
MIAETLKTRTMELRKARDPMGTFLVAVTSKAADLAKAENPQNPQVTDDHALRAINSFIKGADDNIELLKENTSSPTYIRAIEERNLLKGFLPAEASDADVEAFAQGYVREALAGGADRKKLMGSVMQALLGEFGASLNRKTASGIVMKVINAS